MEHNIPDYVFLWMVKSRRESYTISDQRRKQEMSRMNAYNWNEKESWVGAWTVKPWISRMSGVRWLFPPGAVLEGVVLEENIWGARQKVDALF